MRHPDRRFFIMGSAALTAFPVRAQPVTWDAVARDAAALEQCHAILVHQHGAPVVSEVFRGPQMGRTVPVKSVSKTIVAALMGAALDRGEISSPQARLADLAPALIPRGADPRVGAITVENLVTMQAGLERTSGANYGGWVSSANWVSNALAQLCDARMAPTDVSAALRELSDREATRRQRLQQGQPHETCGTPQWLAAEGGEEEEHADAQLWRKEEETKLLLQMSQGTT